MKKVFLLFVIFIGLISCNVDNIEKPHPYQELMHTPYESSSKRGVIVLTIFCQLESTNNGTVHWGVYQDEQGSFYLVSSDGDTFSDLDPDNAFAHCNDYDDPFGDLPEIINV